MLGEGAHPQCQERIRPLQLHKRLVQKLVRLVPIPACRVHASVVGQRLLDAHERCALDMRTRDAHERCALDVRTRDAHERCAQV